MDGNTPVISSSLSAKVLLPWSMCAIMQKFLILSTGNLERSMDSLKKWQLLTNLQYFIFLTSTKIYSIKSIVHKYFFVRFTVCVYFYQLKNYLINMSLGKDKNLFYFFQMRPKLKKMGNVIFNKCSVMVLPYRSVY